MYSRQYKTAKASAHNSDTPAKSQFAPRRFLVQKPVPPTPQNPDVQAQSARVEQSGQGIYNPNIFKYHPPSQPRGIQMKLSIGQPGDKYEQEADKVAADVVQRINAPESEEVQRMEIPEEEELQMKPAVNSIQRMEIPKEEELQMKPAVNSIQRMDVPEEEELQMKPAVNSIQRMDVPEEEELQMKPAVDSIQRMEVPEEEELQMKPAVNSIQRMEVPEEEELQMKPAVDSIQRMDVPEEEELQMKPAVDSIQRMDVPEEEELQMKPEITSLQRREAIGGGEASTDLDTAINSARGSGQPLDAGLQRSMGQAMGADFSGVKIHTDGQSDQLNRSIQARAFTTGQDVFFRQGEYNPGSRGGQELLAHELTHVVQQNGGAVQRALQRKNAQSISIDYSLQEPLVQCQPYYRGGNSLAPKMNEVKIDSRTQKLKNTHGVSLFDLKKGLGKFGGTYEVKSIPDTLKIIQRGRNQNHFEIVPAENGKLDFEEFKNELVKVVLEQVEDE